jgi:deoxyribonuclease-4
MAVGLPDALEYALFTGCETMQVFAKCPRRWSAPALDEDTAAQFRLSCSLVVMGPVFTHASYLINMGAESADLWERSALALADELVRGAQIGAAGVVTHLGRRFSDDDAACCRRIAECVRTAASIAGDGCPPLLLENSAGAGRQFGASIGEVAAVLTAVRDAGVESGVCFDTCHGFAAGIDVRTASGWTNVVDELDRLAGVNAVRVVHANDCKGALGSHKDRHEWIGEGGIGSAGFGAMFERRGLAGAAVIVEMPGDGPVKDLENVTRLKRLRDAGGASDGRGRGNA